MKILGSLMAALIITGLVACSSSDEKESNVLPDLVPAVKQWQGGKGFLQLEKNSRIESASVDFNLAVFIEDVKMISGISLNAETSSERQSDIIFSVDNSLSAAGNGAYVIDIAEQVRVTAADASGLFYASQTLLQLLQQQQDKRRLPKGVIHDHALLADRGFMIDVGRKYFEMDYIKRTLRTMAWYKLNTLHLHFTEWSGFRLQSDKFPDLASRQSYSKADLREIQDYAARYNIMVIPEIDLPAHATHILRWNPDFNYSCESMLTTPVGTAWLPKSVNEEKAGWMIDVTNAEALQMVTDLFEEFIPLFDAPYFHIGGDEWQYDDQKWACPELVTAMTEKGYSQPGDLFVEWINNINAVVKAHGKTTQIWSWWNYSPTPERQNVTSIHPDKDIVVKVWNKEARESIIDMGYPVIISLEDGPGALYSTPGLNGRAPGEYGYFDSTYNYETWSPETGPQILGYRMCLWADGAEDKPDDWFAPFVDKPLMVFSEKSWGEQGSKTLDDFLNRVKRIGSPPFSH